MSLRDTACYTLNVVPSATDPRVVELVEPKRPAGNGEARYVRVREAQDGETYSCLIYGA